MKKLILSFAIIIALASCSKDEEVTPPPGGPVNTGDLRLFAVDTAKVSTISMTGTNFTTILNRRVNNRSGINSFSIKNDGTKFVYADVQSSGFLQVGAGVIRVKTVRVANANGSGDVAIYTAPADTNTSFTNFSRTDIGYVKFGASKIYFSTETYTYTPTGSSTVTKFNTINFDGTGLVSENGPMGGDDITSDGKYIISLVQEPPSYLKTIVIIDRAGNSGAGSTYHSINLPSSMTFSPSRPVFSYNDKFAYYAFVENQTVKVAIINMATKTSEIKTITTLLTATSISLNISVGSDNNRGVVVVRNFENNTRTSKSYIFNLANNTSTSFNNNNNSVDDIYAW